MERRTEYKAGNEPREVSFTIASNPVPKARARVILQPGQRAHAFTPKATKDWEALVRLTASLAMLAEGYREPFRGDVELTLWIYFKDRRRRDADNTEKGIADAMNGIVYLDDSQVADCHRYRRLDREMPRVVVTVREIAL